jgi:hypothetical protein
MSRNIYFIALFVSASLTISSAIGDEPCDNCPKVAHELYDLKRRTEENDRKIKNLEARLKSKSTDNSVHQSPYEWPPHYMPFPNSNSALQLILNPNLAVTYDFGPFAGDFLSPTTLPLVTVDPNAAKSGRYNAQARASQFGFRTLSYTNIGEIKTEVSLDFYGNADSGSAGVPLYQPRLRLAFVEFCGFTIGQQNSNFLDLDAIGETVDYGTILAGSFRHGVVKYTFKINKKLHFALAAEQPATDYTNNAGALTNAHSASRYPDITGNLKYEDSWGHVALKGVWRHLKLKNYSINPVQSIQRTAWGLGVAAKYFIYHKTNIFAQTNFGNGIGRFIIICNGQSAFYDQSTSRFDLQKAMDGILGLEHYWSESFRSNFIYAHTFISVSRFTPILTGATRVTKSIDQYVLNLIFSPIPSLDLGMEYGYAKRKTFDQKQGTANRITLGMLYKF